MSETAGHALQELEKVVIRFAGDSGDGMQLTGDRFSVFSALFGNDLSTVPDYPAEIYQNCNVFNDGAFEKVTGREVRSQMLIPLVHGRPVRFGADNELGVVVDQQGQARIVKVADVGEDAILVHDERRDDPGLAFLLSHLATGPSQPTPVGVFRAVDRPDYGSLVNRQVVAAGERLGPGDLGDLLSSGTTWQT